MLAGGKTFTVLRRETNLELAMLDGDLTATIQPEGLRVGDTLDIAFTLHRHDPVFQGHSEDITGIAGLGVLGRVHLRALWPASKPLRWKTTAGLASPAAVSGPGGREAVIDLTGITAPKAPRDAPARFSRPGQWEMSDFSDWREVSTLMAPLYAKAASLAPASPLKAEAARIAAATIDPKARAAMALALVQKQTRYVFLGMNLGGYTPAGADITWARRFGDCKGKTVLLLALLHELGVQAEPALVSTTLGDGLDGAVPMLGWFDHVLVRAVIAGRVYWLDGTRPDDRDIDDIPAPGFRWALPVRAAGAGLEAIDQPPFTQPQSETVIRLNATGGLDSPAPARAEEIFRGDGGLAMHLVLSGQGAADARRAVREFWTRAFPWITAAGVDFTWDEASGVTRLTMTGAATLDWVKAAAFRQYDISQSSLGGDISFKREPGPDENAPFAVNYPAFDKSTVTIALPSDGAGFRLGGGADVDKTIAGVAYQRRSRLDRGVVTMEASTRAVAREFPFAQAAEAQSALRALAESDVVVLAGGAFGQSGAETGSEAGADAAAAAQAEPAPTNAAGFSRRGAAFLLARDYDRAIADFTAAARLEPRVGKHIYNRGVAHAEKGESALAMADFDLAVRLNPKDRLAWIARARLRLADGDEAGARKAFDAAIAALPGDRGAIWAAAEAFSAAHRYQSAIGYYDRVIAQVPSDPNLAGALNGRCWARATLDRDLQGALADCEASLKLKPDNADALDSRGFVRLRLGEFAKSIADYDAALALRPDAAASLFGRGLAKLRLGQKDAGHADIAAALAIDATIAETFAGYGVKP